MTIIIGYKKQKYFERWNTIYILHLEKKKY
jgi:hypothetical protein